jgi:uncharacterized membrane protein
MIKENMAYIVFAGAVFALGVLGLVYGDFALVWQPVPDGLPGRSLLAYLCATLMVVTGAGMFFRLSARLATTALFVYMLLWLVLLKVPALFSAPLVEASWLGCAETSVQVAGAWVLFALTRDSERGLRAAAVLYGLALIPCGLGHLVYVKQTADFVPAWIPGPVMWAYLTGVAYLAAAAAVLSGVLARPAAKLSALMMGVFTLLVWVVGVCRSPGDRFQWTAMLISLSLTAGAWVVAESYQRRAAEATDPATAPTHLAA